MGAFDGTYDPQKQDLIIGDVPVVGFTDGTMIKAARDEDGWMKKTGADGRTARIRNANKSGTIVFTLMSSSPSCDRLQALAVLDEDTGQGVVPVMVKDRSSKAGFCHGAECWIRKIPDYERAKELADIEFTIDVAELEIVNSGLATAIGP